MLRYKEEGCCTICTKQDNTFRFNRSQFEELQEAMMSGRAWYQGITYGGQRCLLKIGEIVSLCEHTPESLALADREIAEEKAQEAING